MPTWAGSIPPKKTQLAMVVCDHGLGHIRRACRIARLIKRSDLNISIASSPYKVRMVLKNLKEKPSLFNSYFKFTPFAKKTKNSYNFCISKKLKTHLQKCKFILSDNLIEVMREFPQTSLLANFFWHKKNYISKTKSEKLEKYLNKKNLFGDSLFAAPYIKKRKTFIPLPLIFRPYKKFRLRPDILLMPSSEMYEKQKFLNLKRYLQKNTKVKIYVPPKLSEKNDQENTIKIKNFGNFPKSVGICVCRPGLGIISDCCENGIMPVCFYLTKDPEIKYNHKVLLKKGFTFLINPNFNSVATYLSISQETDQFKSFKAQKTQLAIKKNAKYEIQKKFLNAL